MKILQYFKTKEQSNIYWNLGDNSRNLSAEYLLKEISEFVICKYF